jgi:hypothetical protein
MSFVDPAPVHPPFVPLDAEFIIRRNGRFVLICSGECPTLEQLDGFVLIVTFKNGQVLFGGMHPKIRDGVDAPFRFFFELNSVPKEVFGAIESIGNVDLFFSRSSSKLESFIFRFLPWSEIRLPPARDRVYRGASEGKRSRPR